MSISNNCASFHLWWNENLVKYQRISNYYENDCGWQGSLFLPLEHLNHSLMKVLYCFSVPSLLNCKMKFLTKFQTLSMISCYKISHYPYILYCRWHVLSKRERKTFFNNKMDSWTKIFMGLLNQACVVRIGTIKTPSVCSSSTFLKTLYITEVLN